MLYGIKLFVSCSIHILQLFDLNKNRNRNFGLQSSSKLSQLIMVCLVSAYSLMPVVNFVLDYLDIDNGLSELIEEKEVEETEESEKSEIEDAEEKNVSFFELSNCELYLSTNSLLRDFNFEGSNSNYNPEVTTPPPEFC